MRNRVVALHQKFLSVIYFYFFHIVDERCAKIFSEIAIQNGLRIRGKSIKVLYFFFKIFRAVDRMDKTGQPVGKCIDRIFFTENAIECED